MSIYFRKRGAPRPYNNEKRTDVCCSTLSGLVVVAGIKSAVTRFANENNIIFAWQPRFYEHIVRSRTEMNRIAEYIEQNPYNWATDEYNTDLCVTKNNPKR